MTSPDWTLLFQAFADALDWALDAARDFAREYPNEVAAVERVRGFVKKRIAGDPAHVRIDDVLFAFGLVAGVVEKQLGNRIAGAHVLPMAPSQRLPTLAARRPALAPRRGVSRAR